MARADQVELALLTVWLIVALAAVAAALLPFLIPQTALSFVPPCRSKIEYGIPCLACGLTTSFYAMTRGDFEAAALANAAGPYLYTVAALHIVAVPVIARTLLRRFIHAGR